MGKEQTIRHRIRRGEVLVGSWVSLPYPINVEVLATGDADFLLIDGEHGPIDAEILPGLLAAAELHGKPVVFRPHSGSAAEIKRALDSGVSTLMVPMVESAQQARDLVSAAKYPPAGRRGIGPWRASRFYDDFETYMASANEDTALVLQIESVAGLERAAEIAAIDGVDVLYVGPADLSAALGLRLGVLDPELLSACRRIASVATAAGKVAGIDLASLAYVQPLIEAGFTFFTYGSDIGFLQHGSRHAISEFRTAMGVRN
jgi:4-hydroxy-2-oxoheptanedioate aldolase